MAKMAYETAGAGTPVVFLHGLTFDRTMWRPIIARLGNDIRSIAVDLPGHGESPGPGASLIEVADRLNEVLDEIGVEKPVVVGHSIAAPIALTYAVRHGALGIVDVDQTLDVEPFARFVQQLAPALRSDRFAETFAPFEQSMGFEYLDAATLAEVNAGRRIERELVLAYWAQLLETPPRELRAFVEANLAGVTTPCLFVFGQTLTDNEREYLRDHLRRVEIEEWPGRGHLVHLADPERFAARLRRFVEECVVPAHS